MEQAEIYQGAHGRAWSYRYTVRRAAQYAAVGAWIVEAPWAHPVWSQYAVSVVHLRPIEGAAPPNITRPGATHEILVRAISPDFPRAPTDPVDAPIHDLSPINQLQQFAAPDDDTARKRTYECVKAIADRRLHPDSDFRSTWDALFA
jgi:hypothetical protein